MTVAVLAADGTIQRFAATKPAGVTTLPVVEDKPTAPVGHELVGPDYRVEKDQVVAYWRAVPVNPLEPEVLLARIAALEARLATIERSQKGLT